MRRWTVLFCAGANVGMESRRATSASGRARDEGRLGRIRSMLLPLIINLLDRGSRIDGRYWGKSKSPLDRVRSAPQETRGRNPHSNLAKNAGIEWATPLFAGFKGST